MQIVNLYSAALIFLAGFLTYSAISHLMIARGQLQFRVHVLLAAICLLMAALIPSEITVLRAGNIVEFLGASRFNIAGLILISALLPWFFADFADVRPQAALVGSTVLHAVLFLANLTQPFTILYREIHGFVRVVMRGGAEMSRPLGTASIWTCVVIATLLFVQAFAVFTLVSRYRIDRRPWSLVMVLAVGLLAAAVVEGSLVRVGIIHFVALGPFGFIGMIVVMELTLKSERRENQLESESRIRTSEERFRLIAENASTLICEVDLEGNFLYLNPAYEHLLGYNPAGLVGQSPRSLIHPEDAPHAARRFQQLLETNSHSTETWRFRNSAGEWKWFSCSARVSHRSQTEKRVVVISIDVTERKRAEEALRGSEARLREAQRIAHIGNWELDLLTDTLNWSEEMFGIFEIDKGHFAGSYQAFLAAVHPDDRAQVNDTYARSLQTREPYKITYRILLPDGRIKYVQEDCATYYSTEGTPHRSIGTIQDITERRRLEEQLRQSQKMEAIGQLAGGVAHDFNNILAATMMNLDLLREKPHLDPETRDALKELKTEAGRAASLTRQLLMLSRRSVLRIRPLDLDELVANLLKMLGRLLGEQVTLAFERTTALPSVEADPGMLEQVLLNLTVNARDAMPRGGRITLATEAVEVDSEKAASHSDRRQGQFVRLSVSDTGCGMDARTLKRISEPFFTTKEPGKGTGLGLATVYGIVAQHRGWVEVESQVGSGTTFQVYLPASPDPLKEAEEGGQRIVPRGCETLLVVEDEESLRKLLVHSLQRLGYRVIAAANGPEAMRLWQERGREIDLLLTDMVMPGGMSGLELAIRIRAEKPGIKIIISSGYSTEMSQPDALTAEGIAYLSKPYQMSDLGMTLRGCLDGTDHKHESH